MSTKAANQQQRRTPLSLTGGVGKSNQNSGKSADTNGSSNNGASAKNDNKLTASQKVETAANNADTKESAPKDVKKPQNNTDKRQSQQQNANINENTKKNEKSEEKKTQNGAGKVATNGGAKEKHQNGSEKQENGNGNGNGNASNTRSSNTSSNSNAAAKTTTKSNEKSATTTANVKEEAKAQSAKGNARSNEKAAPAPIAANDNVKTDEEKSAPTNDKESGKDKEKKKDSASDKNAEKKQTEKIELPSTRSSAAQPKARATPTKGIEKSSGVSTPTKGIEKSSGGSTPTKSVEKSSGASTPTKAAAIEKSSASQRTRTVTTDVDDVEMEPLAVELSPEKPQKNSAATSGITATITAPPAATSTPGKPLFSTTQQKTKTNQSSAALKSEIPLNVQNSDSPPERNSVPRTFTHIGGRRSIRPLSEYTPSKFQSNLQYRESYRRINTELDVSSTTNTSMNVTVGSEVPNNSSFSFFGRGRKRDRTPPPQQQSSMELHNDADYSPPKRARLDMQMFFNVVASPLTLLRSRFSKTSIQSSTPVKLSSKLTADDDEAEVQNVSGISIEEEINENAESVEKTATEDVTVGKKVDDDTTPQQLDSPMKVDEKSGMDKDSEVIINAEKETVSEPTNVHEVAAGIADTSVTSAKNKRCNVM